MAASPALDARVKITLRASTSEVEAVTIPVGTKTVKFTSGEAIFLDDAASADADTTTEGQQFKYTAGTYAEDVYTFCGITPPADPRKPLQTATVVYISGTSASQGLWIHPVQAG